MIENIPDNFRYLAGTKWGEPEVVEVLVRHDEEQWKTQIRTAYRRQLLDHLDAGSTVGQSYDYDLARSIHRIVRSELPILPMVSRSNDAKGREIEDLSLVQIIPRSGKVLADSIADVGVLSTDSEIVVDKTELFTDRQIRIVAAQAIQLEAMGVLPYYNP